MSSAVGMIISIILLIIVVLVILVLFLPIKYGLDADIDGKKVFFKIKYLGFIRFCLSYDEEIEAILKIFFFKLDIFKFLQKSRSKSKKKKEEKPDGRSRPQKIRDGLATAKRVLGTIGEYSLIEAVMPPVKKFLFKCRPRKIKGQVGFGFKDPSTTGYVTGAIAVLPIVYQTDLAVTPDFETDETYVKGNLHAAGHMRLMAVIILAVGLIGQKGVRVFIGAIRHRDKKNSKTAVVSG
ncbi:MAG: hypothetical protein LUC41_07250 [Clostridiales bacterium]|nr:hypothetical protein [Clostridiales bacterium]